MSEYDDLGFAFASQGAPRRADRPGRRAEVARSVGELVISTGVLERKVGLALASPPDIDPAKDDVAPERIS